MRFSFLVAVEFFFLSIICVGCDACRGIEDVAIELKNFFLQNGNIIKSEEFKCRKDSPSGLLLNANININGEINLEYKLLLCLEEFMYFFRSLFEDKIKVKQGEEELFYSFCRYVAKIIDTENIENGNKQERQLAVLFLNLCKLFFTDNREKNSLETAYNLMEDVRDFLIVSEEVFNIKKCGDSGNQEEHFCVVFINCVWAFLGRFVEREKGKILVKKTLPGGQHTIIEDDFNKNTYLTKLQPELLKIDEHNSIIDSLFSEVQVESLDNKNAVLQSKKPKETFFLKNFSPTKVFLKKTKGQCTVLIYDDFVVFEDTKSREEIVWKRERRNRATPYSFYRLLFENEIRESDIFAKNSEKEVIDILENEIKAQMLYDFKILCSHITEFISWFKEQEKVAFESILRDFVRPVIATYLRGNTDNFVKSKLEIDDIEEKIKSYFTLKEQRRGRYVVCPSEACVKIFEKDCTLTEELWLFLSLVAQGVYEGISIKIKEKRDFFFQKPWFKGLKNIGNSCYINALSQNLFDYEEEMQRMLKDIFLEEKHQLQSGGNKCFTNNFFETIGYDRRQHDSHELFMKIFIPKKIKKLGAIEEPDAYDSFLFCFDSKFECLAANAIKEGNDGSEEIKVKFNEANKKKDIKSIHDVLNFIYDYLKNNYCNLSLFNTTIDTYCDHEGNGGKNCCKKYNIKITKSNEIEVDSYKVYNGLDFSSLIKKKEKEKLSGSCNYSHLKREVAIYKEQTYHNFSDFLVINLKRFTNNQQSILNSIPIPDNICFDGDRYDITGIVCHFGDFSSGHYIAYKKNFGLWFKFDDSVVSVVGPSLPDAAVKCAYMLFFKKNKEIKEGGKEELKTIKKREIRSNEKSKIKAGKIPETLRKQVEERKKREEKAENKRKIFISKLLPYYSLFNKRYFGIINTKGETFVEYLHDIVKDIKKNDTQYILNLKKEYELQFCAFLLLKVQEYCNLSKRIKEIGRNSNKLNEIHEEKPNEEELEKLGEDIIMLICKDPIFRNFYERNNTSPFLKEFVKVFFISFCDFDNTCGEKRLFKEDTLQSLKNGGVEFFFNKDKNINISENRDLPFFLITNTPIKNQQDGVSEDDPKEVGDTKSAGDGKYYCFWSDKLIIARDKKKQANDDNLLNTDKNEINEGNKINIKDSKDINADYDSFENLAVFKKTFEVAGCGFFERLPDGEKSNYSIKNILGDVQNERKQKLDPLLSFIGKIEVFIKDFVGKINKGIEECYEKIRKKDQNFFAGKKEEIKKEYVQQIDDLGKCIAIANEYKKKLDWELKDFKKAIDQTDDKIKKVVKQIDERKEDIKKKQLDAGAQYNTQGILFKFKSKTQVFGGGNKKSIQPEDYKNKLEQLKKELEVLCANKENITDSISQVEKEVSRVETFIESREKEKKKLEDVLKNAEMNFDQYEKRLTRYFQYYKGWENKEEEENKKKGKNKENGKNKEVLTVLSKLKNDITAVLERKEEYTIQSFNINFKDIFNPFNSYSFDLFVSMIEKEIEESIIGEYLIFDLYEHLCFEKGTSKRVLVESGQRFKGVQNLSNTCYINSILQNLVEFKDDLLLIKDCPHDKKSGPTATTIHDTVFEVLGEKGTDPRIGLQNVLNISITNGFGNTGDPVEVYSSLLNYYINEQYRIEVVEGSEVGDFVYEILKENDPSRCNARLILPSGNKEINDIDIINYLYNEEINKSIKKYFPVSAGPCVFKNTIKSKYCEKCKKKEIKIEIECFPYCLIKIGEFIAKANNISDVVKETFGEGIEEEKKEGIDCDGVCIGKKTAKVKESSFYRVMNNCLCFNFAYDRGATNFIDIEDEVKVGDKVYESVCACYYRPGHYIAFKKINDIWFNFDDDDVFPIIDKSLPKMYGEYKPTLVFYKKKKKDKK